MIHSRPTFALNGFIMALALCVAACSGAPLRYESPERVGFTARAVTQEQGAFRVRTAVPGEAETERLFGLPLYEGGVQPVWLEVTNRDVHRARLVLSSIDPDYFPPYEVAYTHRRQVSGQDLPVLENYLFEQALPRQIGPGETVSGFVFTNASNGTKAFNVDIYSGSGVTDFEQFTFFVDVPGFVPDHAEIDFKSLYSEDNIKKLDINSLRTFLNTIPTRSSNREGTKSGRPIQSFFIAEGKDVLRALLRAGWNETSYRRDEEYLADADYLFGRPPDAIFSKGRSKTTERLEIGLWLAPARVGEKLLWVVQFKHALGRRFAIGDRFLGVPLDPNSTQGRDFVLQDLWYAQSIDRWAWSQSGEIVSAQTPATDLHGNDWFSNDEYRAVIWIAGDPVALGNAEYVVWSRYPGSGGETP